MDDVAVYGGLFFAALVAATVFPGHSELVLVGLMSAGYPPIPLLAVASASTRQSENPTVEARRKSWSALLTTSAS